MRLGMLGPFVKGKAEATRKRQMQNAICHNVWGPNEPLPVLSWFTRAPAASSIRTLPSCEQVHTLIHDLRSSFSAFRHQPCIKNMRLMSERWNITQLQMIRFDTSLIKVNKMIRLIQQCSENHNVCLASKVLIVTSPTNAWKRMKQKARYQPCEWRKHNCWKSSTTWQGSMSQPTLMYCPPTFFSRIWKNGIGHKKSHSNIENSDSRLLLLSKFSIQNDFSSVSNAETTKTT